MNNKSSTMQIRDEESVSQPCIDRNQLLYNSFYLNYGRFRLALGIFPARYIFTGLVSAGLAIIYGLKVICFIHQV